MSRIQWDFRFYLAVDNAGNYKGWFLHFWWWQNIIRKLYSLTSSYPIWGILSAHYWLCLLRNKKLKCYLFFFIIINNYYILHIIIVLCAAWAHIDQNSAVSAETSQISIHVWPLWLNKCQSTDLSVFFYSISAPGNRHQHWSLHSDCEEVSSLWEYKKTKVPPSTSNVWTGESGQFFFLNPLVKWKKLIYGQHLRLIQL